MAFQVVTLPDDSLPALVLWGDPEWTPSPRHRPVTTEHWAAARAPTERSGDRQTVLEELADRRRLALGAEAIEHGIAAVAADSIRSSGAFAESLAAVAAARRTVQARLWAAARRATSDGRATAALPTALERLHRAVDEWDERFAELVHWHLLEEAVPGAQVGDIILPALHAFHRLQDVIEGGSCPRCGTTTFERRWSPRR